MMGNGTWKPDSWLHLVHYDSWNSIWKAVLQDGKTLFHAIWCECDRVAQEQIRWKGRGTVKQVPLLFKELALFLIRELASLEH